MGRLALGRQQRGLILDCEVVRLVAKPVPPAEKLANLLFGLFEQVSAAGLDINRVDMVDVEQTPHRGPQWDENQVVLVKTVGVHAFGGGEADDFEWNTADAELKPNWIGLAEEVRGGRRPKHGDTPPGPVFLGVK